MSKIPSLFAPGRLVATPAALQAISAAEIDRALTRHFQGDWGELSPEDRRLNNEALTAGLRLFSAYRTSQGRKFWIITEADRSATTVLLPEDY